MFHCRSINSHSPTTQKAEYADATGNWGERYWTRGAKDVHNETVADGARFKKVSYHTPHDTLPFLYSNQTSANVIPPKVYFFASLVGYLVGMLTTLAVLKIYNHAQPALLYLVPGVLIALWGTALVRGELPLMWAYTEDGSLDDPTDESKDSEVEQIEVPKEMPLAELAQTNNQRTYNDDDLSSFESSSEDESHSRCK